MPYVKSWREGGPTFLKLLCYQKRSVTWCLALQEMGVIFQRFLGHSSPSAREDVPPYLDISVLPVTFERKVTFGKVTLSGLPLQHLISDFFERHSRFTPKNLCGNSLECHHNNYRMSQIAGNRG